MGNQSETPNSQPKGLSEENFTGIMGQVIDVLARVDDTNRQLLERQNQPAPRATPAPQAPQAPKPAPAPQDHTAAVNALLQGDLGPLRAALEGASISPEQFQQLKSQLDQLTQHAQLQITEAAPQNEAHFRQTVDSRWGAGAYDKHFKSAVDERFKEQPALRASRAYYDNVIKLVSGEKVDDLITFRNEQQAATTAAAKEKEDQRVNVPYMLGGGVPISLRDGKVQFDSQDEDWMRRYEVHNGEEFDRSGSSEMLATLLRSSVGKPMVTASIDELEAAFPVENK